MTTTPVNPLGRIRDSYDAVADEYVRRIAHELDAKPFDRALLDRFAQRVARLGPVWDLGCGPGHVARYLRDRGVAVSGLDLSPALVRAAAALNPDIPLSRGDFRSLPIRDTSYSRRAVCCSWRFTSARTCGTSTSGGAGGSTSISTSSTRRS